ncbi:MAG: acyclic terpene utilization AtuA family protein [Dictyoglomaceae bacterium]
MLKIYSPTAILGYGFPIESYKKALELNPDVIAVDAGSTDPGPYYLGKGISFVEKEATKRDLFLLLEMAKKKDIPLIIGSAGGCGTKTSVEWTFNIVKEICKKEKMHFNIALIFSDVSKEMVLQALRKGKIKSLDGSHELKENDVLNATNIVAQIGVRPFIDALEKNSQIIITGRSYDPNPFSALPLMKGYDRGLSFHLGKILECGAIACEPGSGRDGLMGVIFEDRFEVFPLDERKKCTVLSVASHTLYEKSDPYHLYGPDGMINLENTIFLQKDERTVIVKGSKFIPSVKKWIKIEGAEFLGYRGVCIAGIRDPIMISKIDEILKAQYKILEENFPKLLGQYKISFHIYGKNGVMGPWEKEKRNSHELGLVIEVLSKNRKITKTILGFIRSSLLHFGYEGRISTAGNLAFPFSPAESIWGEAYRFSVYHLINEELEFPMEVFKI